VNDRAESIDRTMRPPIQAGEGGSIPTSALHFQTGQESEAAYLVMRYHYSRRMPSAIQLVGTFHRDGGLFGDSGEAVAACIFSIPPTRWAEPVWELSRLVRADGVRVPLSRLIKLTCVYVKRKGLCDLLVSFADWTQRHHGGIYQAASWKYAGQRDPRMDGVFINGQFVTGRNCNRRWGTQSPDKLVGVLGRDNSIEPHYDEGKHLYWKALNSAGEAKAKKLGLESLPYPKPSMGVTD
jgi:hypothetical protein